MQERVSPRCPWPGHGKSHVVFDGRYGKPGHRRQRYRCYPGGVGGRDKPFHRFVPDMPREPGPEGDCDHCEREVGAHEGPSAPRRHRFTAREIAQTLVEVGQGMTYQSASWRVRQRAGRFPEDGERETAHGQLAADWVEVFAPVLFEPYRPTAWPEGTLVVDNIAFRAKALDDDGFPLSAGLVAFQVFAAYGYEKGRAKIWSMQAFPDATAATWKSFFKTLPGTPERVVADAAPAITKAVKSYWPKTAIYYSEWHLLDKMRRRLITAKMNHDKFEAWKRLDGALGSAYMWEGYKVTAWRARKKCPKLWKWVEYWDETIEAMLAVRPRNDERPRDWPRTTAGLERRLNKVSDWIDPRVEGFSNRERMNRLLLLMQLELNGRANQNAYTRTIREWLTARRGIPGPRRVIVDPKGLSTLHP